MDYTERLRGLALNDASLGEEIVSGAAIEAADLDPKTQALVRIAALVAVGGAPPSYASHADDAVGQVRRPRRSWTSSPRSHRSSVSHASSLRRRTSRWPSDTTPSVRSRSRTND